MATIETSESLHLKDYWQVIRARSGIILTLIVITLCTGYVVTTYLMTKQYSGVVQLRIWRQEKDLDVFRSENGPYFDPVFFESEKETLLSQLILYPVIDKLGLRKTWTERFHAPTELKEAAVYGILKRRLKIDPRRGSNVLEITAFSEDVDEAAQIANEVTAQYISVRTDYENQKSNRGLKSLTEQIDEQKVNVIAAKKAVEEIRIRDKIDVAAGGSETTQLIDQELQRKQQMLDEARSDATARRVRYESLKDLNTEQLVDTLPALGLEDVNVTQLREQQLQAESNLENLLKSGFGPDHPRVQSLQATLNKLGEQLKELADAKKMALKIDLNVSQEKMSLLQKDVDTLREQVRSSRSEKMTPYLEAIKEAERQQELLTQLTVRYKQESVDIGVKGEPAQVISQAEPKAVPVRPILWLNMALAGVAGAVLGLGVAFFIEYLDTSVKTLNDVEKTLGVPVLTIVPRGTKPLNQEEADSPHAESYRILRARIDLQAGGNAGNAITVLSGGPGEGKSTTIFNLGFVCAQLGQPTIIVDADLRRPSQHTILGLPATPGLSNYLEEGGALTDYIIATPTPNLHMILAGTRNTDAKNRFNTQSLRRIIQELKQMYQVVLIDSPPLMIVPMAKSSVMMALGVSDASVIAHEVDKTLLVIQHRRYSRDVSLRAKRAIEEVQGNMVGVVLNNVALNNSEGYYYYTAYAEYYDKDEAANNKAARAKGGKGKDKRKKAKDGRPAATDLPASGANGPGQQNSEEF